MNAARPQNPLAGQEARHSETAERNENATVMRKYAVKHLKAIAKLANGASLWQTRGRAVNHCRGKSAPQVSGAHKKLNWQH